MKSYDETVDDMMRFLKSKDVCSSSINSHRSCYQQFQLFMHEHRRQWEPVLGGEFWAEKTTNYLHRSWYPDCAAG